jgi:hypothetical protein
MIPRRLLPAPLRTRVGAPRSASVVPGQCGNATATEESDLQAIRTLVSSMPGGFQALNQTVRGCVLALCLACFPVRLELGFLVSHS